MAVDFPARNEDFEKGLASIDKSEKKAVDFPARNKDFEKDLASIVKSEKKALHITELSYTLDENATGVCLLKILHTVVNHQCYSKKGSKSESRREGEYRKFTIYFYKFGESSHKLTINCGATKRQPGNGELVNYGGYEKYEDISLKDFACFFKKFLKNRLNPPANDAQMAETNFKQWKLSVLLIFEITRRTRDKNAAEHPFFNLPVAAGIEMALRLPDLKPRQFFDLFRGERPNRDNAFKNIRERYEYMRRKEFANKNMTTKAIETAMTNEFKSMPTLFGDQFADLSDRFSAMAMNEGNDDEEVNEGDDDIVESGFNRMENGRNISVPALVGDGF